MLLDLNSAYLLRNEKRREKRAVNGAWDWTAQDNLASCLALGFESWASMLDQGFKSPDEYISFLEGNVSPPGPWQLCTIIAKKYGHRDPVAYCRGSYEHGTYKGFMPCPIVLQKSKEQLKKISDSLENEMKRFQETGEVTLGFKDDILYARVTEVECKLNEFVVQRAENNALKDKILVLEKFVNNHKNSTRALENLLNTLIKQTRLPVVDEASQCDEDADDVEDTEDTEDTEGGNSEKIDEIETYDDSLNAFFLLSALAILIVSLLYSMHKDYNRSSNQELLDNRAAFGTKLLI
uniref:Uncharacterized protein n=1 Tax=viral metagenome TaxID=1070528 RepID=A0A6C0AM90_9ZZZZ